MEMQLENVTFKPHAFREVTEYGLLGGDRAIAQPTIYELEFRSLDRQVIVTIEIPETHILADEIAKLKGSSQRAIFDLQIK